MKELEIYLETTNDLFFELGKENEWKRTSLTKEELFERSKIKVYENNGYIYFENNFKPNNHDFFYEANICLNDNVYSLIKTEKLFDKKEERNTFFYTNTKLEENQIIILKFFTNTSNRRVIIRKKV